MPSIQKLCLQAKKLETKETRDRAQEVISIENLWAGYNQEAILENINLSVKERDYIGIIGPNGGRMEAERRRCLKYCWGCSYPSEARCGF
ncbi:MAG: hypothetical protein BRC53_08300 [Cyanobacteria bacterium SW_6_48_11]|nr:MAG: hypothetical protein BRC53_08300 [Cyanobacteria bacterium SW_6_48_11]